MAAAVGVNSETANLKIMECIGLVGKEAEIIERHLLLIGQSRYRGGPTPRHVWCATWLFKRIPLTRDTIPNFSCARKRGRADHVSYTAVFLLGLNKRVIPRIAHQSLATTKRENLIPEPKIRSSWRERLLGLNE